jgi:hypothetical protein
MRLTVTRPYFPASTSICGRRFAWALSPSIRMAILCLERDVSCSSGILILSLKLKIYFNHEYIINAFKSEKPPIDEY